MPKTLFQPGREPETFAEADGLDPERGAKAYQLLKVPFSTVAKSSRTTMTVPPSILVACAEAKVLERAAGWIAVATFPKIGVQIPFAWPIYAAVSDRFAFVADTVNLRMANLTLAYAADAYHDEN